jgi:hypothetical protein
VPDGIHGPDLFEIIRTTRSMRTRSGAERTDRHGDLPARGLSDLPDLSRRAAL